MGGTGWDRQMDPGVDRIAHKVICEFLSILNSACKWMEIENTLLSEVTQAQKEEYGITHS